jgi:spore coat protein A
MITRRRLLRLSALSGAGAMLPAGFRFFPSALAAPPGGLLDPSVIDKFVMPLVIPPAMPRTRRASGVDYYEIAVRQFRQQILPAGMPATTVWSYGSIHHPNTFNYPAFTVEAKFHQPVRVKWINELVDGDGDFLPHLLPERWPHEFRHEIAVG